MNALADTANFADWFDALREQDGSSAPAPVLPSALTAKLDAVARHYEKQSSLPEAKRHRVGVLLIGANEADRKAAVDFLARRLCLRTATIDAASLGGVHEDAATAALRPLVEHEAKVTVVTGLAADTDGRVRDALAWSSRNVLVVGCADAKDDLDANLRRPFESVIDLAPKAGFAFPFGLRHAQRVHAH